MDRIGRFTVIFATLLLPGSSPGPAVPSPRPCRTRQSRLPGRRANSGPRSEARAARAGRTALPPRSSVAGKMLEARALSRGSSLADHSAAAFPLPSPSTAPTAPGPPSTAAPIRTIEPIDRPPSSASAIAPPSGDLSLSSSPRAGADRPGLPDQPRHRLAALRRPAADRGRRPGQCLGGRSTAHAGQGPLGPDVDVWRRLHPARRRRPGFQQGHHDRAERELLLGRWRLRLSNPGVFQFVNLTDVYFEPLVARQVLNSRQWDIQTAKNDSLLMTADAYFSVHQHRGLYCRCPLLRRAGARPGRADLAPEQGSGPQDRGRSGQEHARRPRTTSHLGAQMWRVHSANLTQVLRLDPAQWSSRSSTTTSRSP